MLEAQDTHQTGGTSPHQKDSKGPSSILTLTEAQGYGLDFTEEPPTSGICEFCGKELEPKGIALYGRIIAWIPALDRCGCERSQAYWCEKDRIEAERIAAEVEEKRKRKMRQRIERLLGESGIKKRFQQRAFTNFRRDTTGRMQAYCIAKEYADNFEIHREHGDCLYIEGTTGTGKTHLAAAIALQLIEHGVPVICKTAGDLLMDIKRSFGDRDANEARILDIYKQVDLLILDDLGKEQCSDWSISTLYSILNDRYEDMKPTIVTTNYGAEQLVSALTPNGCDSSKILAIVSRLRETSTVITMAWEDIRGMHRTKQ